MNLQVCFSLNWMTKRSKLPNAYIYIIAYMEKNNQDMYTYCNKLVYTKHITILLVGGICDKIGNKGSYT